MRLIDADALIVTNDGCQETTCRRCKNHITNCEELKDLIRNAPTIEPERKKGEWLDTGATPFTNNEGQLIHEKMCSKCASIAYFRSVCGIMIADNVCPNCGSDMRGDNNV